MAKTKIIQVYRYAYPHIGGIEADIQQIFNSISDEKFEKKILSCSNIYKSEEIDNVKHIRCPYLFEFAANNISPVFLYKLSRVDTDVLHYHMPFMFAVICHYLARPKYKKMIISFHGGIYGYDKYMKYFGGLYRKFYKDADLIHVYTTNLLDSDPILNENRNKAIIIPFGVNIDKNYTKVYEPKRIKNLLCMGRLVHWKGIQNIIEAIKDIDNVHLDIVGKGPMKEVLEKKVEDYNMHNKVTFRGEISDTNIKNNLFKEADIFVFPSIKKGESYGQVQIQAMQYETPVINTNLGTGVNYISINNETGLTVDPDNVEQLKQAIITLVQNDELRIKLGKNAKKRVENLFDLELIKDKYEGLYI